MPAIEWHKYKQKHDRELNICINKNLSDYEDWKIVTLFYTALHYVDEYLGEYPRNIHPIDHFDRNLEIINHINEIQSDYRKLKTISEDARYRKNIKQNDFTKFLQKYAKMIKYFTPINCPNCGAPNRLNKGNCVICRNPL